ncbi:hypothetical protein AB1Y20_017555 [Prymnesium parvum]|uniref:CRAL-TRIO domain-containing protein n=1 Tax=Prymnesium parvum TaxID=97485 RepID=A0AB34JKK3_PRYPA
MDPQAIARLKARYGEPAGARGAGGHARLHDVTKLPAAPTRTAPPARTSYGDVPPPSHRPLPADSPLPRPSPLALPGEVAAHAIDAPPASSTPPRESPPYTTAPPVALPVSTDSIVTSPRDAAVATSPREVVKELVAVDGVPAGEVVEGVPHETQQTTAFVPILAAGGSVGPPPVEGDPSKRIAPTAKERSAIEEMRAVVGAVTRPEEQHACGLVPLDDLTALRFLRARNCNVKKAAKQYIDYRVWYVKEKVADIFDEPCDPAIDSALDEMYCPQLLPGYDFKQRPIVLQQLGRLDFKALEKRGVTLAHISRRHIRELERLQKAIERSPWPERGHLSLTDVKGASVANFMRGWRVWKEMARIGQNYYPELLGALCLIRAPSVATWAVNQSKKTFIDADTGSKIELHSGDCIKALEKLMASELIPAELKRNPTGGE